MPNLAHTALSSLWDPIVLSVPVFLFFILVEAVSVRVLADHHDASDYDAADARTSVSMGAGFLGIMGPI